MQTVKTALQRVLALLATESLTPAIIIGVVVQAASIAASFQWLTSTQDRAIVVFSTAAVNAGFWIMHALHSGKINPSSLQTYLGALIVQGGALAGAFSLAPAATISGDTTIATGILAVFVQVMVAVRSQAVEAQISRRVRQVTGASHNAPVAWEKVAAAAVEVVPVKRVRVTGRGDAQGIHDHPRLKLGLTAPSGKPAIKLGRLLTGVVPAHPVAADHIGKLAFGLYGNDQHGDCGPTSVANLVRLASAGLLGKEIQPSQEDVYDLYRRSGNPNFNPSLEEGDPRQEDNGVDMQTMLEALLEGGIGDGKGGNIKPVAFAAVDASSDAELTAGVSIFGGILWGVLLENAQKAQTERHETAEPVWSYRKSATWGGHAVLNGAYEARAHEDVISWAKRIATTSGFRRHQLQQAFVVVWPWNLQHPAFQAGVNLAQLAADYKTLTGRTLQV